MKEIHQKLLNVSLIGILVLGIITIVGTGGGGGGDDDTSGNPVGIQAPSNVVATEGNAVVIIEWNPVDRAKLYNLYYSTESGVTKSNGICIPNASSPYRHGNLNNDTTYYYILTSVTGDEESNESIESFATPQNEPPHVEFDVKTTASINEELLFDASKSNDDVEIIIYSLDFGDGTPAEIQSTPIFLHEYSKFGTYEATLTAEDNEGSSSSANKIITIGLPLSSTVNVSNTPEPEEWSEYAPHDISESGKINVAWSERRSELRFSQSSDDGQSFSEPLVIIPYDDQYGAVQIDIISSNTHIHFIAAYFDYYTGRSEVIYTNTDHMGGNASEIKLISLVDGTNSYYPSVACNNEGLVGAVWDESGYQIITEVDRIGFAYSTDNGDTFTSPIDLSPTGLSPDIEIYNDNVYVVWCDNPDRVFKNQIMFTRSTDGAQTFSDPIILSTEVTQVRPPNIEVDINGNILINYLFDGENDKIGGKLAISVDNGETFKVVEVLEETEIYHRSFGCNIDKAGNIYVKWFFSDSIWDLISNGHIMRSSDWGDTFSEPVRIIPTLEGWAPDHFSILDNDIMVQFTYGPSAPTREVKCHTVDLSLF